MNIWTLPLEGITYLIWKSGNTIKNRALSQDEHDFLFSHKDLKPIMEKLINEKRD